MTNNQSELARVAHDANTRGYDLLKLWMIWLGSASAGGIATLLSFSSSFDKPEYVILRLLPSYFLFMIGLIFAGISMFLKSQEYWDTSEHFAEAHNREEYRSLADTLPTVISAPESIANEANKLKNEFIKKSNLSHENAEDAWGQVERMRKIISLLFAASSLAFVLGLSWPAIYVLKGGHFSASHHMTKK